MYEIPADKSVVLNKLDRFPSPYQAKSRFKVTYRNPSVSGFSCFVVHCIAESSFFFLDSLN